MGITPFQGYDVLRHHETQGCTLGYRITHRSVLRPPSASSKHFDDVVAAVSGIADQALGRAVDHQV